MALTVLIYEDNDMLRESIRTIVELDQQFQVVGDYNHVLMADQQVAAHKPQIILMDIDMPGRTGIEAVKQLRSSGSTTPIIMLTVFDDTQHVFDAICAGASGYLLKKHISTRLFAAMNEVLSGGAPMSPSIAHMVIASMQKPIPMNPYALTAREQEILTSLSKGNSYKMMAVEFSVTVDTIRAHIKKVYEKLQVHSQTEAVSKALNEKLV